MTKRFAIATWTPKGWGPTRLHTKRHQAEREARTLSDIREFGRNAIPQSRVRVIEFDSAIERADGPEDAATMIREARAACASMEVCT